MARIAGVVMVESQREIPGPSPGADTIERETRFYITSLLWIAAQLGPAIRAHWMVENGLHWVMDMNFRDDECRVRTDHAPANFTTIKHMALNLIRRAQAGFPPPRRKSPLGMTTSSPSLIAA